MIETILRDASLLYTNVKALCPVSDVLGWTHSCVLLRRCSSASVIIIASIRRVRLRIPDFHAVLLYFEPHGPEGKEVLQRALADLD